MYADHGQKATIQYDEGRGGCRYLLLLLLHRILSNIRGALSLVASSLLQA